jgi:penicillin-binding protein 1B
VGYDDYSDLRLTGAQTAGPIWAEFMKKAAVLPQYSGMREFAQPSGVVDVQLDKATNRLATASCPDDYTSAFVAGTEPHDTCDEQQGMKGFFSRLFGGGEKPVMPQQPQAQAANQQDPNAQPDQKKKKGFFGKIAGIFKDDKDDNKNSAPASKPADGAQEAPH